MKYYNHYNLDEIAEAMKPPTPIYHPQFFNFNVTFQDTSDRRIKVFLDYQFDDIQEIKKIQKHLESIYAIAYTRFNRPNNFTLFFRFRIYDYDEYHYQILEGLDIAFKPL